METDLWQTGYDAYRRGLLLKDMKNFAPRFSKEHRLVCKGWRAAREEHANTTRAADHVDGYDRDNLGESPDY